jgi:phosphatidylserine/phosphatidylglycerophosphate/cardiolipin synthase-like enzyme
MADDTKAPDDAFSASEIASLATVAVLLYAALYVGPIATLVAANATAVGPKATVPDCPQRDVYFAPGPEPQAAILREIGAARSEILVQAYSFTSKSISAALIDRKRWGVDVRILLDRSNANPGTSQGDECASAGISVAIDHAKPVEPISHAKIIIIDGRVGIYGSYNFSDQASKNSEILMVERDPVVVQALVDNWHIHERHSRQLAAPAP